MSEEYKKGGLKLKYIITKANGNPVDEDAKYFVLRYDTDPHARKALLAYAESVRSDNSQLASDLKHKVGFYNMAQHFRDNPDSGVMPDYCRR